MGTHLASYILSQPLTPWVHIWLAAFFLSQPLTGTPRTDRARNTGHDVGLNILTIWGEKEGDRY